MDVLRQIIRIRWTEFLTNQQLTLVKNFEEAFKDFIKQGTLQDIVNQKKVSEYF
jgi:hypothetical protein